VKSDCIPFARQTNQATVTIDGSKTTSIPCKKSGIDNSMVTWKLERGLQRRVSDKGSMAANVGRSPRRVCLTQQLKATKRGQSRGVAGL